MNHVLLVDDEVDTLRALERRLRKTDYQVTSVTSGEQALSLLETQSVAVIVSDQRMPAMDGTELLAEATRCSPDTVQVLMTGYADMAALQATVNKGNIFRFLMKPFSDDEVQQSVRAAVEQHRLLREHRRLVRLTQQQNARLVEVNEALAEKNERLNRCMGLLVHDLRSPLTVIMGYLGLLKNIRKESDRESTIGTIREACDRMLKLIEDTLDLSYLQHGQMHLDIADVELVSLLGATVSAYQMLASDKDITVTSNLDEQSPLRLASDGSRITEVMDNLLSNAIKYSHPETTITVTMTHEEGSVEIAVADQGVGMKQNEQSQAFTEFCRVSSQPTAGESSTGLGLAIVKTIVDQLGGSIRLTSELNKGTTVAFTLPVQPVEVEAASR